MLGRLCSLSYDPSMPLYANIVEDSPLARTRSRFQVPMPLLRVTGCSFRGLGEIDTSRYGILCRHDPALARCELRCECPCESGMGADKHLHRYHGRVKTLIREDGVGTQSYTGQYCETNNTKIKGLSLNRSQRDDVPKRSWTHSRPSTATNLTSSGVQWGSESHSRWCNDQGDGLEHQHQTRIRQYPDRHRRRSAGLSRSSRDSATGSSHVMHKPAAVAEES